jgi:hypothetical protein
MSLELKIQSQLLLQLKDEPASQSQLNNSLRLLSKWRSVLIQNTLLKNHGTTVMRGPLAGMDFLLHSAEGCHIAKLLGCYEQPLQPYIDQAMSKAYHAVLNIGCAEGYYAVGMARKMPNTQVLAFDINPIAQDVCTSLALKNGVSNRVTVGALFTHEDFDAYRHKKVLVLCDIEGGENDLLDPLKAPALNAMDIIVESHECLSPGITQTLIDRFKNSHQITLVQDNGQRHMGDAPQWFYNLAHLDQLLATWEWRSGATPWLVMQANS